MKTKTACILAMLALLSNAVIAEPMGTAFTYQGQLTDGGQPANGSYDLKFTLHDAASGGNAVAGPITNAVSVTDGLFTVPLDFGPGAFTGDARWLEVAVRTNGGTVFTNLSPRQALAPAPHALFAPSAGTASASSNLLGTLAGGQLAGTYSNALSFNNAANSYTGSGAGLTGLNANQLASGTVADARLSSNVALRAGGNNFTGDQTVTGGKVGIGTSPLERLDVGGGNLLVRGPSNFASGTEATAFLGDGNNYIKAVWGEGLRLGVFQGVDALTVKNGGNVGIGTTAPTARLQVAGTVRANDDVTAARVVIGANHTDLGYLSSIGGGEGNLIPQDVNWSSIGGGQNNSIGPNAWWVTIGGGLANSNNAGLGSIGGGFLNTIQTNAGRATIAGGVQNTIESSAEYASVGGGWNNRAGGPFTTLSGGSYNYAAKDWCVISGGRDNVAAKLYATIGGGSGNSASGSGAVVGGGGWDGINVAGNTASGDASTISGGFGNTAGAWRSTVGGGSGNAANGNSSFIGGGISNYTAFTGGVIGGGEKNQTLNQHATVGGGYSNSGSGDSATVAGGSGNNAEGDFAAISGGWLNKASGYTASIGGGATNTASANWASIGGGWGNTASGRASMIPGGYDNLAAGWYSFAAGRHAKADGQGSFVWADANDFDVHAWGANEFVARATGGYWLFSAVDGTGFPTAGVTLAAGSGSWSSWSDRNSKENIQPTDGRDILERLAAVSVQTWNYRSQDKSIRHIGPMAQDFAAAFGLGEDEKRISAIDADGVALAAIQGLNQKVEEKEARIKELELRLEKLEQLLNAKNGGGR